MDEKPIPLFWLNDWVEYTEPEYPYRKHRGHIDQINWSDNANCWFYILLEFPSDNAISIPGNDPKKMAGLVKI